MNRSYYTIRVAGRLDSSWSDWFDGLELRDEPDQLEAGPVTALTGWMDQAALHGTLAKIRDLGLPLLSVKRRERRRKVTDHGVTESTEVGGSL